MRKHLNSPIAQYALIACLAMALLVGQMFKLHMHILHSDTSSPNNLSGHVIEVHAISSSYDQAHEEHAHDDTAVHHHNGAVEINSDSFVKKAELLLLLQFVLLFFTLAAILNSFFKYRVWIKYDSDIKSLSSLYLLHPPLRAPPARLFI